MKRTGLLLLIVALAAAAAPAAPPEVPKLGEGKGQVVLTWDEFVKITGYDPAKKGPQVLTVPWAQIEELLGVKVERPDKAAAVDLPWQDFKSLLEWSIKRKAEKPEAPPPADYIITSCEYSGKITEDSAQLTLTLKLNILREKGWKRIPVLPAGVAVVKATLAPAEGVYLNSTPNAYELLTEKSGAVEAVIEFSVSVSTSAGINDVGFARVHPGPSVLDLEIARENVDVKIANAQSQLSKQVDGRTAVAAAIPAGVPVSISWERALPKVEAAPTKLYAETRTLVAVADEILLCRETVDYNILHTAVRELKLAVPKGASVLTVIGDNVLDWRVGDDGVLSVMLRGEVIGSYALHVTYERSAKDEAEAPVIRAVGVERERGYVGVVALVNVEITAEEVAGATKIDARQLPADISAMTSQPILLAFRYVGKEFSIPLSIKKHDEIGVLVTIVDAAVFTGMQLNDGRRMAKVVYSVRNNRNQFLRLTMPEIAGEKIEIWSVSVGGNPVAPAKDDQGNVLIPLIRSASRSQDLASFPVEVVYIETPEKVAPASGKLRVELPRAHVPVMHVMYNYYAPPEGEYTVGWGRIGISGPMSLVEEFTALATGRGAAVVKADAAKETGKMAAQFQARAQQAVAATGATPIRVSLPINGKLFKLEKILALKDDPLWFEVTYRNWKVAK